MADLVDELAGWCAGSGVTCERSEDHLRFRLDPSSSSWIRAEAPDGTRPLRLEGRVRIEGAALDAERRSEVIEDVVLSRAGLVDARGSDDGEAADIVVVVYPEGLNRHTFLEALFEVQKVGLLLQREVAAARAAEQAIDALARLTAEDEGDGSRQGA